MVARLLPLPVTRFLILASLSLAAGCAPRPGPVGQGPFDLGPAAASRIDLFVQLARFRADGSGNWDLHVHAVAPRSRLLFLRDTEEAAARWRAEYEWGVVVRVPGGRQVGGGTYAREVLPGPGDLPDDPKSRIGLHEVFTVPPGRYRVEVTLSDRNSVRAGRYEEILQLESEPSGSSGISDIELLEASDAVPSVKRGTSGRLDASVPVMVDARTAEDADVVAFLYEAYDLPGPTQAAIRLRDASDRVVREASRVLPEGRRTVVQDTLGITGVEGGPYTLEVALGIGARGVVSRRPLIVQRPLLADGRDVQATSAQLRLYTDRATVDRFESLDEPARVALIDSLWKALDPTPGTARNEAAEEFVRRLREADERWGVRGRPGWRSEAGRIHVAYGDPDETSEERTVLPARGPLDEPRTVLLRKWIYRDPPVVFVFVVENDGRWTLLREASTAPPPMREVARPESD